MGERRLEARLALGLQAAARRGDRASRAARSRTTRLARKPASTAPPIWLPIEYHMARLSGSVSWLQSQRSSTGTSCSERTSRPAPGRAGRMRCADLVVQRVQSLAQIVGFGDGRRRGRFERLELGQQLGARLLVLERGDQRLQVRARWRRGGDAAGAADGRAACATAGDALASALRVDRSRPAGLGTWAAAVAAISPASSAATAASRSVTAIGISRAQAGRAPRCSRCSQRQAVATM